MIKLIFKILNSIFPKKTVYYIKRKYRSAKALLTRKMTVAELKYILRNTMKIEMGDTVFVHSSISKLYIDFEPEDIFSILQSIVGENGTLLFPCWQFRERAEEFFKNSDKIFNVKKTRSKMGFLTEYVRHNKNAIRSIHPTNSVVAIGKHAKELTSEHHLDLFPCGIKSPFYKMMNYNAKLIGLGVDVDNLAFLHCVEDVIPDKFPIETRKKDALCIDVIGPDGVDFKVTTLIASSNISERNPKKFFSKHISSSVCFRFKKRNSFFFVADSSKLFNLILKLSSQNITIYNP